jgi:hypothetical protein
VSAQRVSGCEYISKCMCGVYSVVGSVLAGVRCVKGSNVGQVFVCG